MYLNFNVSPICFFKHVDNLIKSNLFLSAIERLPLSLICKARFFVCRNYVKDSPSFQDNPPAIDFIYRDKTSSASHHCRIMNTLHPSAFLCVSHIFHIKNAHIQSIAKIILFIIIHKYFSSF